MVRLLGGLCNPQTDVAIRQRRRVITEAVGYCAA